MGGASPQRRRGRGALGSAALDLCFVAAGWLDGYWERALHPWDSGRGRRHRHGRGRPGATELDGTPFDGETGRVLASNGPLHEQMIEILRDVSQRTRTPWP